MIKFLEELVDQVTRWPASVVMVVALSFAGIAMKKIPALPNKYIPSLLMLQGTVIFMLISDRGKVGPTVPYPLVVLGLYGCVLGMISWAVHGVIWKYMIEKLPGLKNGENTSFIKKPDDEKK